METQEYEHTILNVWYNMSDGSLLCEPLEIVQSNGELVAFFILN